MFIPRLKVPCSTGSAKAFVLDVLDRSEGIKAVIFAVYPPKLGEGYNNSQTTIIVVADSGGGRMDTLLTVERTPREYEVLSVLTCLEQKGLLNSTYFIPRLASIDEVNGVVQDIANIKLSRVFDDWQAFVAVFNEAEEKYPEDIYCDEWRHISKRYGLK